jgi:hypothetical protein
VTTYDLPPVPADWREMEGKGCRYVLAAGADGPVWRLTVAVVVRQDGTDEVHTLGADEQL